MSAAAGNVPPPVSLHRGWYVHPGMPQHVHFQMASNCFQATGEVISKENTFNYENEPPEVGRRSFK